MSEQRKLAVLALVTAESAFLVAFGWTQGDGDFWEPPPDFAGRKAYRKGHAINAQKQRIYSQGGEYRNLAKADSK